MMVELTKKGDLKGGEGLDKDFAPDVYVKDGDQISNDEWCFDAIWIIPFWTIPGNPNIRCSLCTSYHWSNDDEASNRYQLG